jgi:hypothetical protein
MRFSRILSLSLLATACSPRASYTLEASARAGEANARVRIERVERETHLLTVVVENAPAPAEIRDDGLEYRAWIVGPDGDTTHSAKLDYTESDRRAAVMTTTTLRDFELRITVEHEASPTAPSDTLLFHRSIHSE